LQVRRRRWARGSRVALLLASLSLLVTGCSRNDIEKRLRFGWPSGVTKQGHEMRVLWSWSCVAALALGVVVWGLIFWCCIRYRKRDDSIPRQTKYNFAIETVCVIFPFIVIAVLFWRTAVVEDDVNHLSKNPDVRIQVDAFKWNWQFEYHQYHGTATDYLAGDARAGQAVSTVGSDTEIPVLVIPVNQTIQIVEHSFDVIHSFWVPEFLFKRDVIPFNVQPKKNDLTATRHDNRFEFTATTTGSFVGRCAELCGTYHSEMDFEVRVVTQDVFANYIKQLQRIGSANPARQSLALSAAGMKPYATTTIPFVTDRTVRSATSKRS
jgi:cytochrome c oxidase subunit 2